MTENGCSEDLPCSQQQDSLGWVCGIMFLRKTQRKRRTARRTTDWSVVEGASAWQAGVLVQRHRSWELGRDQLLAGRQGGERPSRFSTTMRGFRGFTGAVPRRDRCAAWRPTRRSFSFACRTCGCVGRGNGAPVGWPGSCGGICGWSSSGPSACRRTAKYALGSGSCMCWSRMRLIAHRAASGSCTAIGSARAAMADLLGADFGLAEAHKLYAPVTTFCCSTKTRYSRHLTARLVRPV